jgi:hypothetical protein
MAAQVKFKANRSGIAQMLSSSPVCAITDSYGDEVKETAESLSESGLAKFRKTTYADAGRAVTVVGTTDAVSIKSNAKHNSLLKGLKGL